MVDLQPAEKERLSVISGTWQNTAILPTKFAQRLGTLIDLGREQSSPGSGEGIDLS